MAYLHTICAFSCRYNLGLYNLFATIKCQCNIGNLFAHGFKITAVITALMLIYTVLALNFLFPDMVDKKHRNEQGKNIESSGKLSDSQIDTAIVNYG